MPETCLYFGEVVHKRLNPIRHELRYRVFNVFMDIDDLEACAGRLWLFSYNRFNLFSLSDYNHGPGDGTPIRQHVWDLVRNTTAGTEISKIFMFCYPRVLGYVFNPLTVYYAYDAKDHLRLMIYEVNNTFGGRHSYVIPVAEGFAQSAPKHFFVSPFNAVEGQYKFHFTAPAGRMALGVSLSANGTPILNAYVSGMRRTLSDSNLLKAFLEVPFLTLKVIGAIHLQAMRLLWKGLRLKPRPRVPNNTVDFLPKAGSEP
jgi:DUF1365 family protein